MCKYLKIVILSISETVEKSESLQCLHVVIRSKYLLPLCTSSISKDTVPAYAFLWRTIFPILLYWAWAPDLLQPMACEQTYLSNSIGRHHGMVPSLFSLFLRTACPGWSCSFSLDSRTEIYGIELKLIHSQRIL